MAKAPSPATRASVKKAVAAKKPAATNTAVAKASAKKVAAKSAAKKVPATKAPAKKVAATKAPAKKVAAKKVPAKKVPATKAPARKVPAKKVPAKKAPARQVTVKKVPAKKAAAGQAPAPKKPAKSPFRAPWLAKQEADLRTERDTYLRQADSLQAEADALVADFQSGDSQFDEDGGEGDTLSSERERDLALSAQARAAVEEIDHALAKFALGTYGICEASGDPIPKERLEAIPWARVQVQYKTGGIGRP